MSNVSGKVWGTTQCIIKTDNFEVHRISVVKNGYCSMHKHVHKHNMFFIESGKIQVETEKNDYALTDKTVIMEGQWTTVKAGEFHRFRALEETIAFEIYWVEGINPMDIVRRDHGGVETGLVRKSDDSRILLNEDNAETD